MNTKTIWIIIGTGVVLLGVIGAFIVQQRVGESTNLPTLDELLASQDIMPGMDLPKLGEMPEFQGIEAWINSEPLTPADLKGKVVLVDFWTYSCINCIRTFPYLRDWWTKYEDEGFVLIGVHTPEFQFEKDLNNVSNAAQQFELTYPIALDNEYLTWRAYRNRFWPATYIFDRDGILRYTHHGEGEYDVTEGVIQQLLGVEEEVTEGNVPNFEDIHSPETYFGYARAERFVSPEDIVRNQRSTYSMPPTLSLNQWALAGLWTISEEYAEASEPGATLTFRFDAPVANFVMEPPSNGTVSVDVFVDGVFLKTIEVDGSNLFEAYRGEGGEHEIRLEVSDPGVKIYTITFGA